MFKKNSRKRVVVLSTGGTIASRYNPETGRTEFVSSGKELVGAIPELGDIADVEVETVFTVPSFQITPGHVLQLVDTLRTRLAEPDVDGVVVTHGTDTMEETCFLTALLCDNGDKPVVFTGAQLSGDMLGADGPRNLVNALRVAASEGGRGFGPLVAFADGIYTARDVTKAHTSQLRAFVSARGAACGEITRDEVVFYRLPDRLKSYPVDRLITDIGLLRLMMGVDANYLRFCLERGARGIVLQAFGIGNATPDIVSAVAEAVSRAIPVIVTSRCFGGRVTPVYGSGGGRDLADAGAIFAGDLSGEKARLALMVLLSRFDDASTINREIARIAS
ncbi:MAG: asparaginase [Salinisphaera sp.]|jgi:L-asparaginase|nr:asparaginase [Salinisphaera sp.]